MGGENTTARHSKGITGAGWLNIVLGALVMVTPFFTGDMANGPLWSNLVTGALVIILAGYNVYAASHRHSERAFGPAVANVILGVWVLASAFLYATTGLYTAMNAVLGVVLAAAAGYNAWAASDARGTRHVV